METVVSLETGQESACDLYSDHEVMPVDDSAAPSFVVVIALEVRVMTCIEWAKENASPFCQGTVRGVQEEVKSVFLHDGMKEGWTCHACVYCLRLAPFQDRIDVGEGRMVAEGDCG